MSLVLIFAPLILILWLGGTEGVSHELYTRSAVGSRSKLWPGGVVSYSLDSSVSARLQAELIAAMSVWERDTCVRFQPRTTLLEDYVEFTSKPNEEYCTSDSVGRQGGRQVIALGYSCQTRGDLLHVLGHVLGLWNEQSRPDRNDFIKIVFSEISEGQESNFHRREDFEVGYEGVAYDYGSMMHLGPKMFSKSGAPTTEVNNPEEFERQGRPTLGQRSSLSEGDSLRVRRLYFCPGEGLPGILHLEIKNAEGLTILLDPRVTISVVDGSGTSDEVSTTKIVRSRNPTWNMMYELYDPVRKWQFFRLQIVSGSTPLSVPLTVPIVPGAHSDLVHCIHGFGSCEEPGEGRLNYGYTFFMDGNECSPNPCRNGGTCADRFVDFECTCPRGFAGKTCEMDGDSCVPNPCVHSTRCIDGHFDFTCVCLAGFQGKVCDLLDCRPNSCGREHFCVRTLTQPGITCNCRPQFTTLSCSVFKSRLRLVIRVNSGVVQDRDGILNTGDPYVNVFFLGQRLRTRTISGTNTPVWNQALDFGCRVGQINSGSGFEFEAFDDDGGGTGRDDRLSYIVTVRFGHINHFPYAVTRNNNGFSGHISFTVELHSC